MRACRGPSSLGWGHGRTYDEPHHQRRLPTYSPPVSTRKARRLLVVVATFGLSLGAVQAQQTANSSGSNGAGSAILPRWGQASALLGSTFVVHGGKTQGTSNAGGGGYTYTSGPNSADLLTLDLSQSFNASDPPWTLANTTAGQASQAPAVSFHTLSPLGSDSLLLFGGDGAPNIPVQTRNDSAYVLQLPASTRTAGASWQVAEASWQQPMRRIYHSAEADRRGNVWVVGGMKDDGSNILLDEMWSAQSTFTPVASPRASLAGATSSLLADGSLILLGGLDSVGMLHGFDSVMVYSTQNKSWSKVPTAGANSTRAGLPAPRRGHVAVTLPDKRVFVHGGASADMLTVYGDAWILDWSVTPPTWTEVSMQGGPGARYGHSAVAYGRQVLISFGWTGTAAAGTAVSVFNGIDMTSSSPGSWSGGGWTSTYKPDPQAGAGSGTPTGGGSSSSSGGKSGDGGESSSSGGSSASLPSSSGGFGGKNPSPSASPKDPPRSGDTNPGATAGAVIGAVIGLSLVAGAGYALYRRWETSPERYRRGDGADGLLGGPAGRYDPDMLEKDGGNFTAVRPSERPAGPRMPGAASARRRADNSTWTAGNVGHAFEGSKPHLRTRLALLTGIGVNTGSPGHRFDMLAGEDEDEDDVAMMQMRRDRGAPAYRASALEEDEDDLERADLGHRIRERSYGRLEQEDDIEQEMEARDDLASRSHARGYVTSPFEDPEGYVGGAAAIGLADTGALAAGGYLSATDDRFERASDVASNDHGDGQTSGPSQQSHTNTLGTATSTRSSYTPASSHSGGGGGNLPDSNSLSGGFVSFSDASYGKRRGAGVAAPLGPRAAPDGSGTSPLVKRSPTWWDRFMSQSFLERSASGRLLHGPRAGEPIRDPAQPPNLSAIAESPRSTNASEENPFGSGASRSRDGASGYDELGRLRRGRGSDGAGGLSRSATVTYGDASANVGSTGWHGRSLSSLRTATSSQLEQMQHMDVVQRTRSVASSRRTRSSTRRTRSSLASGTGSDVSYGPPSRMPSARRRETSTPASQTGETSESPFGGDVVWQPSDWQAFGRNNMPATVEEEEDVTAGAAAAAADQSADLADMSHTSVGGQDETWHPVEEEGGPWRGLGRDVLDGHTPEAEFALKGGKRWNQGGELATQDEEDEPRKRLRPLGREQGRAQDASETPSITPATTKRARQNPHLTSPLRPPPSKEPEAPLRGSVRDRVQAIERKATADELLPVPRSPVVSLLGSGTDGSSDGHQGGGSKTKPADAVRGGNSPKAAAGPNQAGSRATSPAPASSSTSAGGAKKPSNGASYSVGLAMKPKLFVANPDDRGSDGS